MSTGSVNLHGYLYKKPQGKVLKRRFLALEGPVLYWFESEDYYRLFQETFQANAESDTPSVPKGIRCKGCGVVCSVEVRHRQNLELEIDVVKPLPDGTFKADRAATHRIIRCPSTEAFLNWESALKRAAQLSLSFLFKVVERKDKEMRPNYGRARLTKMESYSRILH